MSDKFRYAPPAEPGEFTIKPLGQPRPAQYLQLPRGVKCKCLALWIETDGSYWCCGAWQAREPENEANDFYARGEHMPGVTR